MEGAPDPDGVVNIVAKVAPATISVAEVIRLAGRISCK